MRSESILIPAPYENYPSNKIIINSHHADIRCAELTAPDNGTVMINNADLLVDTVATYSCDQGYVLAGDTVRTCKERGDGTVMFIVFTIVSGYPSLSLSARHCKIYEPGIMYFN